MRQFADRDEQHAEGAVRVYDNECENLLFLREVKTPHLKSNFLYIPLAEHLVCRGPPATVSVIDRIFG